MPVMTLPRITCLLLLLALAAPCAGAVDAGFERYRIILDRKPFGVAPPPQAGPPVANTIPLSESFARTLKMSALIEKDDGTIKVGLIDTSNNDSFFIAEGEIINGIELVSANYDDEEAVLRKGSEMAIIKLQSEGAQPLTPAEQKARLQKSPKRTAMSYAERRRKRQEQRRAAAAKPPPEPALKGEELQKHLREYQMEVIRQGLPPLPLPLTQEMDDQLVAEGVLPPTQ